jgi:CBS-domain-containing membrane protein
MKTWRVSDVMTTRVVSVRADTSYHQIVDTLTTHNISAAPVVDSFDHVVGVVSETDLLHKIEFTGDVNSEGDGGGWRIFEGRRRRTARTKAAGDVAEDLMSAPAITAMPGTPIAVAARRMHDERVTRLPVVDDLGRLVGIVTRGDLLRVFQRTDAEIRQDVVQEVLRKVLAVGPGTVRVEVHNGVVRIEGQVDRRSAAALAIRVCHAIPGVVDVVNELDYRFDDSDVLTWSAA